MTLKYEITFLDYWHIGSGLSAGAKLDSSVLKDGDNLPYIGGKTIKGLAREMATLLENKPFVETCFGNEGIDMGGSYFSNATLSESLKEEITSNHLQDNLYDEIASTQIDNKGIAVDGSLREVEVVIPVTLLGEIADVPDDYVEQMHKTLKMIKRMGLNRNRGLGRCKITVSEKTVEVAS